MRGGRMLVAVFTVFVRCYSVLLGLVMLARIVMMCCLQVVMCGGRVVGGSLVMVLGCGVLRSGRHRSILLGGKRIRGRSFLVRASHGLSL